MGRGHRMLLLEVEDVLCVQFGVLVIFSVLTFGSMRHEQKRPKQLEAKEIGDKYVLWPYGNIFYVRVMDNRNILFSLYIIIWFKEFTFVRMNDSADSGQWDRVEIEIEIVRFYGSLSDSKAL